MQRECFCIDCKCVLFSCIVYFAETDAQAQNDGRFSLRATVDRAKDIFRGYGYSRARCPWQSIIISGVINNRTWTGGSLTGDSMAAGRCCAWKVGVVEYFRQTRRDISTTAMVSRTSVPLSQTLAFLKDVDEFRGVLMRIMVVALTMEGILLALSTIPRNVLKRFETYWNSQPEYPQYLLINFYTCLIALVTRRTL